MHLACLSDFSAVEVAKNTPRCGRQRDFRCSGLMTDYLPCGTIMYCVCVCMFRFMLML